MTTTELRALMAAATPGPWRTQTGDGGIDDIYAPPFLTETTTSTDRWVGETGRKDAALIVALLNSAEELLLKADLYDYGAIQEQAND